MIHECDLEILQQQVRRARTLVRQTEIKVEELAACMREIDKVKARVPGPGCAGKAPMAISQCISAGGSPRRVLLCKE